MAVDPDLVPLLQLIEAGTPIHTLTPAEARASFRKLAVDSRPPGSMAEVASVEQASVAGAEGPLPARVFRPLGADGPVPTVVLLHGGGFVIGDLDTHEAMARAICAGAGAVVVSGVVGLLLGLAGARLHGPYLAGLTLTLVVAEVALTVVLAAKGGVEALVRSAAATYAGQGLRVNAVAPGMTETPMTAGMKSDLAMMEVCEVRPPASVAKPTIGRLLK